MAVDTAQGHSYSLLTERRTLAASGFRRLPGFRKKGVKTTVSVDPAAMTILTAAHYDLAVGTAVVRALMDTPGAAGNDNDFEVVLGSSGGALSADFTDTHVVVTLGMDAGAAARYDLAVGTAVVRALMDAVGAAGNSNDFEVVLGSSGGALAADFTDTHVVVTLGMDAGAAAYYDLAVGTAVVRAIMDAVGAAGNSNDFEVVIAGAPDASLSADFTSGHIVVTLGTDGAGDPDAAKNTATLIAGVINGLTGVGGSVFSGDGGQVRSTVLSVQSLANGADVAPDAAKNTATLIAAAVNGLTGVGGSVFSGDGEQVRSTVLSAQSLTGGADVAPDAAKNTATLIAGVINGLTGVGGSVYSGAGSQVRSTVLSVQSFTGGLDTDSSDAIDVTVPGVSLTARRQRLIYIPPMALEPELQIVSVVRQATNTVRITFANTSGAPIDAIPRDWDFYLFGAT